MIRQRTLIFIVFISLMLCVIECILLVNKDKEVAVEVPLQLVFSHESGFYDEDFELEIFTDKGGDIYYTLDGSEPDNHSLRYNGPIHITDASVNENVYSMRTDVSVGFLDDEIEQYSIAQGSLGYTVPDYKVDKATIVRAVVYYNEFQHSEIRTESYFVGFSDKKGYEGMNVLSIVTDPNNLFDDEKGIYVTGVTFKDYWDDVENKGVEPDENWLWWPANYRNKGREWEREASCQFFDKERKLVLNRSCGIRVHGGISRGQNPRALNLYARESYGGNGYFEYKFWDNDYYASAITLSQGGNDYYAKIKEPLFSKLLEEADLEISLLHYEPYIMFLDGEYWGVYWLSEQYTEKYMEYYYGVDSQNVIMIRNGELEEGDERGYRLWENMIYMCETLDMTNEDNYDIVCDLIDIESYIDYYAVMIYAGRTIDWPNSNYEVWRTNATDNSQKYADGKWRWMVFDMNSPGMETEFVFLDSIEYVMKKNKMFCNMMTNNTFRQKLLQRIDELGDTVFEAEKVNRLIDDYIFYMMDSLTQDEKRFFGKESEEKINSKIEPIRHFFEHRHAYIEEILDKYETIR